MGYRLAMSAPRIAVVGSVNIDLVAVTERIPSVGETILGTSFSTTPGGKGANQAIAAAKAGGSVTFVGAVGDDTFAVMLRRNLRDNGVDIACLREIPGSSGVAVITVDARGQNNIVVVPGANASVTALTASDLAAIAAADVLVCQLEIPLTTVIAAAHHAVSSGTTFMLNPSPAQELPADLLDLVDVMIVNQTEAAQLGSAALASVPHVVTTLGAAGADYRGPRGDVLHVDAPVVAAIDSTGAGDAFAGALAVAWTTGPVPALGHACTAGALATTRIGASAASPTRAEIDAVVAAGGRHGLV